jgi:hypothetical protein
MGAVKGIFENWAAHQIKGRDKDAPGIIGRCICSAGAAGA